MYYLQSRYYDPEIKRFINCDDVNYIGVTGSVIGYNLFAYCENEPVNCADYTGKITSNIIGAIIAGVIGAVGGYFLATWLADKIGFKKLWQRSTFISAFTILITASSVAIGYFVGPYVAKAWNYIGARLAGLMKNSFKSIGKIASNKMSNKINVPKHLWNKVLGKNATNTNVKSLIYKAIKSGEWRYQSDGIFKIGDAWVWNGISNLWGK